MSNAKRLLPCPFCGGEAKLKGAVKSNTGYTIWCECLECHANTSGYCPDVQNKDTSFENVKKCKKYAIKEWNKRA